MNFPMIKWAKDLFPICRSLTGEGTKKTLNYFLRLNPEFKFIKFKSGKKVFDWVIPLEWNIKDAYIQHKSGKKYAEFKKNNLHLVGYSTPINKYLTKNELLKKIHTQKDQPDAIPYVTSYYNKNWGFCLSENQKKKLPNGKYKVRIDSSFKKGHMNIVHALLKGKKKKEVFFSSYVCHPSMANNELSGPVLLNAIMLYIKSKYKKTKYSYRFVLLPETIGSIAYLSKFKNTLKKKVICGFNLTCVGDERSYSYVSSPKEKTLADKALEAALRGLKKVKKYSFINRGSDERQYCSPGIDLPLCAFSRSKEYPEYHTDKDNFKVVTEKGLEGSFNVMKEIIDAFELGLYPKNVFLGEANLGKRNLYPEYSQKKTYNKNIFIRKNLLAYSDGSRSIFEISNLLGLPLKELCSEYKILKLKKVLS
tara:strand:+ start:1161 stop:2423 length:1263 start_codon:yes stop_codon:yes gene_type:complete